MTGINKAPIAACIETEIIRVKVGLQPQPLGKGSIIGVVIQNPLSNADNTGNNSDIMVGKGSGQPWQMIPGQESPVIYAKDLEQIYVRIRSLAGAPIGVLPNFTNIVVMIYRQESREK